LVALIELHPDVARLTTDLGNPHPAGRDLVMAASTWPDLIRGDHSYTDLGYGEKGPITSVSNDHVLHKAWHFIDMPLSLDGTPVPPAPDANTADALNAVEVLIKQLNSNEDDLKKSYDLVWLMHLEEDLHQPLHCTNGITKTFPDGDAGGNLVRISGHTGGARNLHALWDDVLGNYAPDDPATHLPPLGKDVVTANSIIASLQNEPMGLNADAIDPNVWVSEGVALAKADVYNLPDLAETTYRDKPSLTAAISDSYWETATRDARARFVLAAHRLVLLLKPILDRQSRPASN